MKKIVWAIIAVAVVGYFINSYTVNEAKREAEKAEAERIEQATKTVVNQMVTRTNAISDWEETLSKGERFRSGPILTVELERLWLQQRPILFIGSIKDVATYDNSQYVISVERNLYGSSNYLFYTRLQLSLISQKEIIDSFLQKHPNLFKGPGFFNDGVAVIAKVKAIRTSYISGEEGERIEIKIGDGELLDIVYTGKVRF